MSGHFPSLVNGWIFVKRDIVAAVLTSLLYQFTISAIVRWWAMYLRTIYHFIFRDRVRNRLRYVALGSRAAHTFLVVVLLTAAHLNLAGTGKRCDLSKYDKFGPVDEGVMPDRMAKVSSDLRKFLWEHWRQRKLGFATVTTWSLEESIPETTRYFVEPAGKKGTWQIEVITEVKTWPKYTKLSRTRWSATVVRRILMDKDYNITMLPDDSDLTPDCYYLYLANEHGHKTWL